MKHAKPARKQRLKLILTAAGTAALGVLLIFLSIKIRPASGDVASGAAAPSVPATTTAPVTAPAPTTAPVRNPPPANPKAAIARNMSGMLLLFGLVAFTACGACIVLLILDIRRSRPAWKTQTRYPRRR